MEDDSAETPPPLVDEDSDVEIFPVEEGEPEKRRKVWVEKMEDKFHESEDGLADAARAAHEELGEEPAEDVNPNTRKRVIHEPTAEVRSKHEKTHIPFRPWCAACVAGRCPNAPHHSQKNPFSTMGTVPEAHVDYCFFRKTKGAPNTQ